MDDESTHSKFTTGSFIAVIVLACAVVYLSNKGTESKSEPRQGKVEKRLQHKKYVVKEHETKHMAKLTTASVKKMLEVMELLKNPPPPPPPPVKESYYAVGGSHLAYNKASGRAKQFIIENLKKQRIITHKGISSIDEVAFGCTNQVVLFADQKGEVYLYDLTTGKELSHDSYKGRVSHLAVSAAGSHLAMSGRGKPVMVKDRNSNKVWHISPDEPVTALALTEDGIYLGVASGGLLRFYDTDKEMVKVRVRTSAPIKELCFSPDSEYAAASHADGSVSIYELEYGSVVANIPQRSLINALAFSPDSRLLAVGGEDKLVKIYDLSSMSPIKSIQHSSAVISVAFSPRGRRVISSTRSQSTITPL